MHVPQKVLVHGANFNLESSKREHGERKQSVSLSTRQIFTKDEAGSKPLDLDSQNLEEFLDPEFF